MYVDARDNYSETELKNRASVCEQRQFDAPCSGGQARQGCERQPSVAAPNIWMTLYISIRNIRSLKSICNVREHFVSVADVSCCVGVADWECVVTFKTALRSAWKHSQSLPPWQQQWTWSGFCMLKWLTCIWYTGLWMEMSPAHFSIAVRNHLRATFGNRRIGRSDPVAWPPRSPDLTGLDFFLWGHMKQLAYEIIVETEEDLVARITVATGTIADMPGIFERTRQSMVRRYTTYIQTNGRAFEQFLWMPLL